MAFVRSPKLSSPWFGYIQMVTVVLDRRNLLAIKLLSLSNKYWYFSALIIDVLNISIDYNFFIYLIKLIHFF